MKYKIILLAALLIGIANTITAQNKIDNLVNSYSSSNTCKYTSAIERNPKTREVEKVVKVLELSYSNVTPFVEAFRQESKKGNFSEHKSNKDLVMTLIARGSSNNRIYMLKAKNYYEDNYGYANRFTSCTITIIVKYK